jgi:PBSX family phage terminase large subunit
MIEFSEKQADLVRMLKNNELKRINLLEGAVRSGKTWISLIVFALWVATQPKNATFLMVARTLTTLKRNCLELLQNLVGENNFTYNLSQKQGTLFGRVVYLEGVSDVRAEGKIRGMTLNGAYCDEVTLFTEDFFTMLLSRLSMAGAKLFCTTNPDTPQHWLNVKYIKRAKDLDMLIIKFNIDDNKTLDRAYVDALKKEYTGVFYKRFILGQWVVADGACYPQLADAPEKYIVDAVPEEGQNFISIGVDWGGNKSLTTFVATMIHGNFERIGFIKDHHITGRKGSIDGDRVNTEFIRFVKELQEEYNAPVKYAFCDSAEQYLNAGLAKAARNAGLGLSIGDSHKAEILQRIICLNTLFNTNRAYILDRCQLTIDGLRGAMWDEEAAKKGQDKRLDDFTSDIDIVDAAEYSFSRFMRQLTPLK